MKRTTRRQFLSGGIAIAAAGLMPKILLSAPNLKPILLKAENKIIEINKKPAKIMALTSPGKQDLTFEAPGRFYVQLENALTEHTLIHWHGLLPPSDQDGVPELSQEALAPGSSFIYDFMIDEPGTHWMHSHFGLQEQKLLAAPLIIHPANRTPAYREIILFLQDFVFADPVEIFEKLRGGKHDEHAHHAGMSMGVPTSHLHDFEPDAFLANQKTLDDPDIIYVESGEAILLRIINAAATTNFVMDFSGLQAKLIAVDGVPVKNVSVIAPDIAIAQRLDVLVSIPKHGGVFPILAKREGEYQQAGLILATSGQKINKISMLASQRTRQLNNNLERQLQAMTPLPNRSIDRDIDLVLGEGAGYQWGMYEQGKAGLPIYVKLGQRVRLRLENHTSMSHPIHVHGHRFQVVSLDNQKISGAVRDTIWLPVHGKAEIVFDALNPGRWALHCHHLYHMMAGMMTSLVYQDT